MCVVDPKMQVSSITNVESSWEMSEASSLEFDAETAALDDLSDGEIDFTSEDDDITADAADTRSAIETIFNFFEEDAAQNKQTDHQLEEMMARVADEKCISAQKSVCLAMIGLIAGKKRRREMAVRNVLLMNALLIQSYVQFRGGVQALRVYNVPNAKFDLETFGEKETESWFRFSSQELFRLRIALGIAEEIVTSEQDRCSGVEALCMLCMYYAFPTRRFMMIPFFGTSTSRLSRIISHLRFFLFSRFSPGLAHPPLISADKMDEFSSAVYAKCEVPHIFSFIDGTVRPTAKPEINQGVMYNGKDRVHALKYQVLVTPDGIMRHVTGPYCGSRHDQHMVNKSEVLDWVLQHDRSRDGHVYVTYADAGYAVAPGLMRPFPDSAVNISHKAFNDVLTSVRVCVEWEFGDIVVNWAAVNYVPGQKILSVSRPGQQYIVAALLSNCRNCLRGNLTSTYFQCKPPKLEDYLRSLIARK